MSLRYLALLNKMNIVSCWIKSNCKPVKNNINNRSCQNLGMIRVSCQSLVISQKKEIFRICVCLVFKPLPQSAIVMAQMEDSSGPHTSKNTAPWNLAQTPLLRDKKLCRFIIGNFLLSDKKAPKNKVLPTNFVKVL